MLSINISACVLTWTKLFCTCFPHVVLMIIGKALLNDLSPDYGVIHHPIYFQHTTEQFFIIDKNRSENWFVCANFWSVKKSDLSF